MTNPLGKIAQSTFNWVVGMDDRYRESRRMRELDDHILQDTGITREELLADLGSSANRWQATWSGTRGTVDAQVQTRA